MIETEGKNQALNTVTIQIVEEGEITGAFFTEEKNDFRVLRQ